MVRRVGEIAVQVMSEVDPMLVAIRDVLAGGRRVLIVGSPPGTFDDRFQRDPRVLLWPSTSHSAGDGSRVVPAEVGAVLITSMVSHELSRNVRSQAKDRHLACPHGVLSPGGVRRVLDAAIALLSPVTEEPKPMPKASVTTMPTPAPTPAPAPKAQQPEIIGFIDETIAGLQLIRELAVKMAADAESVREQSKKLDVLRELLK